MCLSTQLCVLVLTGSVLLSIFHGLEATVIADEDQVLEAKKNLNWPRAQEQVTSGEKSLLRNFKEWQNSSDLFHNVSYQHLAGTLSQKKKLLTTGLSSKQGIYLMSTLMSIHISRIFAPLILTGQLLVTLLAAYLSWGNLRTNVSESFLTPILFKQIADYAFLKNFATNLSNYFLMIEDNIHCFPNVITAIQGPVIW